MKPCCDRIHYPTCFRFISALAALALSASLSAQQRGPRGSVVDNQIDAIPASMQKNITVMVELNAAPAAKSYSAALKVAQDQADAARNYALAHPSLKSSKTLLAKKPQPVQISAAAATQIASEVKQLDQAQRTLATQLTGANIGGKILFRAQRSYNGIVLAVAPNKIADIANLPGVKAVHPMHPKFLTTAFSDIDFLGTRAFWSKAPFGVHGENIKVADIDTGLDYIHTDFGGPGPSGYTGISDKSPVPNPYFPTQKVPGGFDFAGDNYNANQPPGTGHDPSPDPNPFDCNGHGTATASLIAGYGVTNAGFTYAGSYDAANPAISSLSIAPGHAPNAKLFPLRVFGCTGSTNLVVEAIEWAMDPNGDGNFSDHMDVINMSLGSNEGYADDADDIAASNAAAIGILVCSAAGNAGDSYYIHSSPAAASGTLSVGATFNDQNGFIFDASVTGNSPNLTGVKYPAIYASTSPHTSVTGDVVYARPATADVPLTNAAQVAGHIVLIDRGVATFATKAANAQAAGAIGIIVANTTGDPIVQGATGTVTVPDVMISTADGAALKAAAAFNSLNGVPANPTNVTIAPDNGSVVRPPNPPGTGAGAGSPDTLPSYTSRGPRLPDSALKPDLSAPAEVTGVAVSGTGNQVSNFNGTSSATPHVSGEMALLRQLHPTWTVQELNALACETATHDLFTVEPGPSPSPTPANQVGPGRVGAGRIDLAKASQANVVAYNGTDPNLIGVSFGVVEVPADGTANLTKAIKVTNKGTTDVTYNITYQDVVVAAGAGFSLPSSLTVTAGTSISFNVSFSATGSALRHNRDASVGSTQATTVFASVQRQFLTEKAGYAVLTPASGTEPAIRVALYAAPKPVSAMHIVKKNVVPDAANGSFNISLSGLSINTGASFPTDIVSMAKSFELQYSSPIAGAPDAPTDPNVIKYVGVTSDWANRTTAERNGFAPVVTFGIEGFGDAPFPEKAASDKEIFVDLDFDGLYDVAIFLTSLTNSSTNARTNVYWVALVDIAGVFGPPNAAYFWDYPTNGIIPGAPFTSGLATNRDTNTFNNSVVHIPVDGLVGTGFTAFQYQVITFDRNGSEVDETPVLFFDAANPGLDTTPPGQLEPFVFTDSPATTIPANYNGNNVRNDASQGVLVFHYHNGAGSRSDVVAFRKPTITGFSPTAGHVGDVITITGSNFGPGTVVRFFNNKVASITVLTSNTLTAVVPAGAITGPIIVSNAAGSSTSPGNFTVLP